MRIIIAGDYAPVESAIISFQNKGSKLFQEDLIHLLTDSDYAIVNLECPILEDNDNPRINKCGPHLSSSPIAVKLIQEAGFNCVTLANNHILDYGRNGLISTLNQCKYHMLDTVGVGMDINDASTTLYKQIGDKVIAIINCCEHEFSIATDHECGANPLNPIKQYYSIQAAKSQADYVFVIVHGGPEYYSLPTIRMQDTYRYFVDAGADVVINHHQHCYSGYEIYHNKPIFYGLGNFYFEAQKHNTADSWFHGYMVELNLDDTDSISFSIHPYIQGINNTIKLLDQDAFTNQLIEMNSIITNSRLLKEHNVKYHKTVHMKWALEPIQNRWIKAAQIRGILPSFVSKKWLIILYNVINCESHRDKLLDYIYSKIK